MVLCPPTIFGPYSEFALRVVQSLQNGGRPLVDEGREPVNLIHVDNLVEAILSAIKSDHGWGELYLVNEVFRMTWQEFFADIAKLLRSNSAFVSVSSAALDRSRVNKPRSFGVADTFKVLLPGRFVECFHCFRYSEALTDGLTNGLFPLAPDSKGGFARVFSARSCNQRVGRNHRLTKY
jgi:hypothetical protein